MDERQKRFDADVLDLFRHEMEVDIETWSETRGARRTTVWIVVAGDVPYVRSYRGPHARWYQDVRLEPHGAIHAGSLRVPVMAILADDPESVEACSRALQQKYRGDPSVHAMLVPLVLPTTLRLEPA